jgi:hypothetical protein
MISLGVCKRTDLEIFSTSELATLAYRAYMRLHATWPGSVQMLATVYPGQPTHAICVTLGGFAGEVVNFSNTLTVTRLQVHLMEMRSKIEDRIPIAGSVLTTFFPTTSVPPTPESNQETATKRYDAA